MDYIPLNHIVSWVIPFLCFIKYHRMIPSLSLRNHNKLWNCERLQNPAPVENFWKLWNIYETSLTHLWNVLKHLKLWNVSETSMKHVWKIFETSQTSEPSLKPLKHLWQISATLKKHLEQLRDWCNTSRNICETLMNHLRHHWNIWSMYETSLRNVRNVNETSMKHLKHLWNISETSLKHSWNIYVFETSEISWNIQNISETFLKHLWNIFGTSKKHLKRRWNIWNIS